QEADAQPQTYNPRGRLPLHLCEGEIEHILHDTGFVHRNLQQMRGSCSPLSMSRMRLVPKELCKITRPAVPASAVPILWAPTPSGSRRNDSRARSAWAGGTKPTKRPSLATCNGSSPRISQTARTVWWIGIASS